MSAAAARLTVEGLSLSYGRIRAVRSASFSLRPGRALGLCGHNGAGKSSIVRMLAGLAVPDSGTIAIDGIPQSFASVRDAQQKGVALVDQELSVVPTLTVAENLALGESGLGLRGRISEVEARQRLDAVGLSGLDPGAHLEDLSIGQRQLVEVARAIGRNARLFILDEPTATLNAADIGRVFAAIREVTARGCSVIYVSHRLDEVLELCDDVVVMRDGSVEAVRTTESLTGTELVRLMLGHVPARMPDNTAAESQSAEILKITNLTAGPSVHDFELAVRAGSITALAGQIGSGTSDVLRAIAGLATEVSGEIELHGRALKLGSPRRAKDAGIGYISADRKGEGLFLSRPIADNLASTRLTGISTTGVLTPKRLNAVAGAIARTTGVDASRIGEPVSRLSGGNQQKTFIGRWLKRQDVRVLVLDEPTRGVDVAGREEIHAIIRQVAQEGAVVLFASSDMEEVLALADTIVAMRSGRVVSQRARRETDGALLLSDMTHGMPEHRTG